MQLLVAAKTWRRGIFISVGALVISTLGIQASDLSRGLMGNLAGVVFTTDTGPCASGETLLRYGAYALCMDTYEASPGGSCPYTTTDSELHTRENLATPTCLSQTAADVQPWRFVSYTQAQQLCGRTGKRLPTAEEWHRVVIGQADYSSCALYESGPVRAGTAGCVAPSGVHDLVGNVWEWMDDTIVDGLYEGRALPESGYIEGVDGRGIVLKTTDSPSTDYGSDYAWISHVSVRGILRGGFYASGEDGGVFAQNLTVPLDLATAGVGFRCVRDV